MVHEARPTIKIKNGIYRVKNTPNVNPTSRNAARETYFTHELIEYNHFITIFIWWNPVKLLVHMISDSVYKGIIAMEITPLEGSTEKARSRECFSGINDWILNTKTEYNEYWILYSEYKDWMTGILCGVRNELTTVK